MFKCDKCNWHVSVEGTNVCSQCARYESSAFLNFVRSKKQPIGLTPLHEKVWDLMVNHGKTWRINDKYLKGCAHPFVKDTQGKCVFCRIEAKQQEGNKLSKEVIAANLRESAERMRRKADEAIASALAIESGFYTPPEGSHLTKRQQAIQRNEKWYDAEEPCKYCGLMDKKYVANSRCSNCGK